MIRRLGVIVVWVVATMVATTVALAAVRSVAGQVIDGPDSPLVAATTTFAPVATSTTTGPTTTIPPATTTPASIDAVTPSPADLTDGDGSGDEPDSDDDEGSGLTTTSQAPGATPAPSSPTTTTSTTLAPTTSPPASTTTTEPPAVAQSETYQLIGGWVRIAFTPNVVSLDGAGPNAGFSMEVENSGPTQVEVEFSDGSHESKFKAEWSDGELKVETSEDSEDND